MFENLPKRVHIREVGPRDGLQNESVFVPTEVKKEFIQRLAAAGVSAIEITSFVNPKWIPALADCAEIGSRFSDMPGIATNALVPNMKGLEGAEQAGMKDISVFMSATEAHNKSNINKSIDETLRQFETLVPAAKARGMQVRAGLSTAFGCPYEGETDVRQVVRIVRALRGMGVDEMGIADTIGVADPLQVQRVLEQVLPICPVQEVSLHFHDTQGTALANIMVAMEMGITHFDSSLGGLGGCPYAPGASGNVPTEHLVYAFERMGIETGIDLEKLLEVGVYMQQVLGHPLPSNGLKAYLGRKQRAATTAVKAAAAAAI
ncbi:MAG: hydroxymethylglutaryl-CoA lyase [Candidatus Lambdaproteobacteria bacterium]|nr:hydroxymethylglutaryl-CoA lyase [Candidatus Lambdaproteobacteria bacterium]